MVQNGSNFLGGTFEIVTQNQCRWSKWTFIILRAYSSEIDRSHSFAQVVCFIVLTTTQWTVVVRAAQEKRSEERPALGQLLEKYWRPLYFYARQRGLSASDAEDATQEFMRELIEGEILSTADPPRDDFATICSPFGSDSLSTETAEKPG